MTGHWDAQFEALLRERLPGYPTREPLPPTADLADLGLGSMEIIGLVTALESEYGIYFPDEELNLGTFATPDALWRTVTSLRDANTADKGVDA